MARKKELTKDDKIKNEVERLNNIFANIEDKKRKTVEGLINESAFMRITLDELKNSINANGVIDEMSQGSYTILRESPYVRTYNSMIQRYTTINDKLIVLLPKDDVLPDDEFDDFIMSK